MSLESNCRYCGKVMRYWHSIAEPKYCCTQCCDLYSNRTSISSEAIGIFREEPEAIENRFEILDL